MRRYLLAGILMALLATPALADEACGGDDVAVFPGLGGTTDIFGLVSEPEPQPQADVLTEEDCGDAITMDVEPRPGMLVKLLSPSKTEELVCTVTSEVIGTYRARHGEVDYLLAPDTVLMAEADGVSLRISHVITTDPDYVSPEGLRVGDTVEHALEVAGAKNAIFTTGGLCLKLPSGWTACFDPESAGVTPGGLLALSPESPIRDFHLM